MGGSASSIFSEEELKEHAIDLARNSSLYILQVTQSGFRCVAMSGTTVGETSITVLGTSQGDRGGILAGIYEDIRGSGRYSMIRARVETPGQEDVIACHEFITYIWASPLGNYPTETAPTIDIAWNITGYVAKARVTFEDPMHALVENVSVFTKLRAYSTEFAAKLKQGK